MDILLETESCEHISCHEASRLMIMPESTVLIPKGICIYKGIFIPENSKLKDCKMRFWNGI